VDASTLEGAPCSQGNGEGTQGQEKEEEEVMFEPFLLCLGMFKYNFL
jgi:hypothetical protein